MWNPFKKRTIVDDAKDFEPQYRAAQILLFQPSQGLRSG